jgi:leader peptidase (prepilin peptidase)/N-methyltransferase
MITDFSKFSLDYENLPFIICFGLASNYFLLKEFPAILDYAVLFGFTAFYILLWIFYPRGIGLGDVIFAPVYGFLTGHPYWIVFLNSSYIIAILWAILSRKKNESIRNKPIPMGVFFGFGLVLAYLAKVYLPQNLTFE